MITFELFLGTIMLMLLVPLLVPVFIFCSIGFIYIYCAATKYLWNILAYLFSGKENS